MGHCWAREVYCDSCAKISLLPIFLLYRFRSMAPMYYRGAKAAICVFDVTNEDSLNRVATWLRDLKAHADPHCVICIAGNKADKPAGFDLARAEVDRIALLNMFHKPKDLSDLCNYFALNGPMTVRISIVLYCCCVSAQ